MQTTPTFDALVRIAEQRNATIAERDRIYASEGTSGYWHTLIGTIQGLDQALETFAAAGFQVRSAEYLAVRK